MSAWVYIMTNQKDGVLYVGTTSSLPHRITQHRSGAIPGFTQKYGLKRLEGHATMPLAHKLVDGPPSRTMTTQGVVGDQGAVGVQGVVGI